MTGSIQTYYYSSVTTVAAADLMRAFPLLWEHRRRIAVTPEYYACSLGGTALFGSCYFGFPGNGHLSVGILLSLWERGVWSRPCPTCRGTIWIYHCGGSPLSGSHSWEGFCSDCQKSWRGPICDRKDRPFSEYMSSVGPLLRHQVAMATKYRPGRSPVFNWGLGRTGVYTPPEVERPCIVPVPFDVLCEHLAGIDDVTAVVDADGKTAARFIWKERRLETPKGNPLYIGSDATLTGLDSRARFRWDGLTLWDDKYAEALFGLDVSQSDLQYFQRYPDMTTRWRITPRSLLSLPQNRVLFQADSDLPPLVFALLLVDYLERDPTVLIAASMITSSSSATNSKSSPAWCISFWMNGSLSQLINTVIAAHRACSLVIRCLPADSRIV